MALFNLARCFVGNTPGTGNITVGARVPPWISFSTAGVLTGSVSYAAEDYQIGVTGRIPINSECGTATYNSVTGVLSGRTVANSSNSNALVNLSSNAEVYITAIASDFAGSAITSLTGDVTGTGPGATAATLATVNSNVGSFGSATQVGTFTVNGKGLTTAAANVTITPAIGSITGLGTGVATALGNTAGGAGGFALVGTTPPTGAAGGSLSGTYPNPSLAAVNSIATSLAVGGATIGANALAVTGTVAFSTDLTAGGTITGNLVRTNAAGFFAWTGRSLMYSPADGIIELVDSTAATFSRLQFGGTTSSFPSIKRNSAALNFRLADDSADAAITSSAISASGQITSTLSTGTAPFVVASTTLVANLHAATADASPASGLTGLGTGVATALAINVGSAGAFVTFNGALGTPSSGTATNLTGLPIAGITGLGTGVATALAANVNGSGAITLTTSPIFVTPNIAVATATSVNKLVIVAPATASTLTVADGKALIVNNALTLAGTDATTMTFPATSSTVLTTGNSATTTVGYLYTAYNGGTISSGTYTPAAANQNYQYYTNNGAHTLAVPAADSAIDILITNGASAGTITFSGYTVGSSPGSAIATTNTNRYIISIRRINAVSTYSAYALQ